MMPIFVVLRTNTIDNDPTSEIHFVGSSMEKCMENIKDYIKRVPLSYKYDRFEIEEWNLNSEPPMTKVTGFPFFRNGTVFLTIRVISQLEGMTPISHRNIPKIRKMLNTLT